MTTQPEALRLADALIAATVQTDAEDDVIHVARWFVEDAAAELCRLSAVEAQRDLLLEALHLAADFLEHSTEFRIGHPGFEGAQAKARAAIAKADGGQ